MSYLNSLFSKNFLSFIVEFQLHVLCSLFEFSEVRILIYQLIYVIAEKAHVFAAFRATSLVLYVHFL